MDTKMRKTMELKSLLTCMKQRTTIRHIVLAYLITIHSYAILCDGNAGQCCSQNMPTPNVSDKDGSQLSFTEAFIAKRTVKSVDLKKLIAHYSLICPVQQSCGVDIDNKYIFTDEVSQDLTGCRRCTCDRRCIFKGNCCPGTHFGYVEYECVDTHMYPEGVNISYIMVNSCSEIFNGNVDIIEKCKEKVEPCIGTESGLIYKNQYCGQCNKEAECTSWKLDIECEKEDSFKEKMATFASMLEMKDALDAYDCRILFRIPDNEFEHKCTKTKPYYRISKDRLISRCNVSGLWDVYDGDLEWACANFINPYKEFRNVFCYICNPSRGSKHTTELLQNCSLVTDGYMLNISDACVSLPSAQRLAPYKNVYCYMCSQGYDILFESNDLSLTNVVEHIDMNMSTYLQFRVEFSGQQRLDDLHMFVIDLLKEHSEENKHIKSSQDSDKTCFDPADLQEVKMSYTAICGAKTLCNYRAAEIHTSILYGNPVCKSCSCASTCAENRACCPDVLLDRQPYSCFKPDMFPSFYKNKDKRKDNIRSESTSLFTVIDRCINDNDNDSTKQKCSSYNTTDRIFQIPVGTESGATYKNSYCYACNNNQSVFNLKFQVYCDSYIEHKMFRNTQQLFNVVKRYCNEISFVSYGSKACLKGYDSVKAGFEDGEKFVRRKLHPSQFEFNVTLVQSVSFSDYLYKKQVKNVFDRCNKTGYWTVENDLVKSLCESTNVNMLSLLEYRIENNVYKNFACFICNPGVELFSKDNSTITSECLLNRSTEWYEPDINLISLCNETGYEKRWFPYKNLYCSECNLPPLQLVVLELLSSRVDPAAAYKYIFSLSLMDFEHLDTVRETEVIPDCFSGTYDHVLKQCRQLSCSVGFQLYNSTCKPLLESASHRQYSVTFILYRDDEANEKMFDYNREKNETFVVSLKDFCRTIVDNVTSSFERTTNYTIGKIECASQCASFESQSSYPFIDVFSIEDIEVHISVKVVYTESVTVVHTALVNTLNRQFRYSELREENGLNKTIVLHSKAAIDNNVHDCASGETFMDFKPSEIKFRQYIVDQFFICGQVNFNIIDVSFDSKSKEIYLKQINVTFDQEEYKIENQTIIICVDDFMRKTYREPDKIVLIRTDPVKSALIIFSLVCTIISLLCIFLTLITYCFISALRTIAGKNIMMLCVSLFCSQASLQFGINVTNQTTLCTALGMCIHLSWLSSFCAMNICSFHTFKVFFYNDLSSRPSHSKSKNRLSLKYMLYVICLPILFVLITVLVSLMNSKWSYIGYGEFYCFISDFYIFLGTFLTPACLIFISNIVFFSLAFHKIRTAPNVQRAYERNNFYICLRLCAIVGVTWPLLIIDNTLEISWFSFVVAGVNASQGLFVFVSFVLNKRVASFLISSILENTEIQSSRTNVSR